MEWKQTVFGAVLVGALTVLAGFYAWRQVGTLRRLRGPHGLSDEEVRWRRGQAWRRLLSCGLMLSLALLLGYALLYLEGPAQHLIDQPPADTSAARQFLPVYGGVWIAILLMLLAVVLLAAVDIWSTRLFSLRQQRKILADRRAMLEREVARLRQEGNGHG